MALKTTLASLLIFILTVFSWTAPVTAAESCTRWVDPAGNDSNPGTQGAPWRTLQHAADSAAPGDAVCAGAGTYPEAEVRFATSGTAGQPIRFTAPDGATVTGGLNLTPGTSHVVIDGFTVRGFDVWGITLAGDNADVVLSRLTVLGGEAGIRLTIGGSGSTPTYGPVRDVLIADSTIRDCVYTAVDCTPGPCDRVTFRRLEISGAGVDAGFAGDGIAVERGSYVTVEDSYVHDNGGDGIDLNSRDLGRDMPGIMVRRNRVGRNGRNGIKAWAGGTLANNLIWDSGTTALVLEGGTYAIVNNTVASIQSYNYLAVLGSYDAGVPATVTLVNNIFSNDDPRMGGSLIFFPAEVTLVADHNLYHNPYREGDLICAEFLDPGACFSATDVAGGAWTAASGQGAHSRYGDPRYRAPGSDFHLTETSPAVDAGTPAGAPAGDLDGRSRDALPDLGAYELGGSGGCSLGCSAQVAAGGEVGSPVTFRAEVDAVGCSGPASILWSFGDGTTSGDSEIAHAYTAAGTYGWSLAVTVDEETCDRSGTVTIEEPGSSCTPGPDHLCLSGDRFRVETAWTDFAGNSGPGTAVSWTADTGYFWFFDPANVELILKVLDGRPINGYFWVFYGALSNVAFTVTVTDTETGERKVYQNPSGEFASVGDTQAFGSPGSP